MLKREQYKTMGKEFDYSYFNEYSLYPLKLVNRIISYWSNIELFGVCIGINLSLSK